MELRNVIESAFAEMQYPGDDRLLEGSACDDALAAAQYFRGRTWQGHSVYSIRFLHALGWLSDAAFHYFLPTHLIAIVEDPGESDVLIDDLRCAFNPPRRDHGAHYDRFVHRISQLTHPQREAVVRVYELLAMLGFFADSDVTAVTHCFSAHANPAE